MKKIILIGSFCMMCLLVLLFSRLLPVNQKLLDPNNPTGVIVWNYYNGKVKDKFDELVTEFNETIGAEKGIVIEAQSYGDVNELAEAVYAAANQEIGSMPMPDLFAAYPDNAFRIDQIVELADLKNYFTDDELSEIKNEFMEEGIFGEEKLLKILPIAKSTEILYLNKTYWDAFSSETGADIRELDTWEGLVRTAKQYYEHTGSAFFGMDANANFMLISAMQLGEELYSYEEDLAVLNLSEENACRIWENYYIPYINGYFTKVGRFSSDDARTGLIAAYTGSTAGASYFPTEVAQKDSVIPVEVKTLPYPHYEGGKSYAVQQGAGMCIVKSDEAHEYAASIFLKWFIDLPQNLEFAVATGYLPVKSEALNTEDLLYQLEKSNIRNVAVRKSIITTVDMMKSHKLYGNKSFQGSFDVRNILEDHLLSRVRNDIEILEQRTSLGEDREQMIRELTSEEKFKLWYQDFTAQVQSILE